MAGTSGPGSQTRGTMTPPPVLYIEDDENDVRLMRQAWERVHVQNPLHVVSNGQEALDYLSGEPPYANRADHPMPCLVLLDLKLPKVSGWKYSGLSAPSRV